MSQLSIRRRHMGRASAAHRNRRRVWVVHLWEAFLLLMDDFDRLLEFQLRRKLDGVVAAPVPVRRARAGLGRLTKGHREEAPKKSAGIIPIQLRPDSLVFLEHS
jgi:hypothetical protein